jgi:hypothetical protein
MAEVATIMEINGSPGVKTSLANKTARFCTADVAEPVLSNPCKIPATGFNYSFRKSWILRITGDFNQVRDIYTYGDGTFAQGWGLSPTNGGMVRIGHRDTGDSGCPLDQYAVATGQVGVTGHAIDDPVNGHPYYIASGNTTPVVNFDTCTANAPLLIDSGPYTDDFDSKIMLFDVKIPPQAEYGAKSPKSITTIYNIF